VTSYGRNGYLTSDRQAVLGSARGSFSWAKRCKKNYLLGFLQTDPIFLKTETGTLHDIYVWGGRGGEEKKTCHTMTEAEQFINITNSRQLR
jgi:hypothetical protein